MKLTYAQQLAVLLDRQGFQDDHALAYAAEELAAYACPSMLENLPVAIQRLRQKSPQLFANKE